MTSTQTSARTAKSWTVRSRPHRHPAVFAAHAVASKDNVVIVAAAGVARMGAVALVAVVCPGAFLYRIAIFPEVAS
jgi:hypothetical protein